MEKVEEGLADSEEGRIISNNELKSMIEKWSE